MSPILFLIATFGMFWFVICYLGVKRAQYIFNDAIASATTSREVTQLQRMYENEVAFWVGAFGFVFIALMVMLAAAWGFVK